MKKIVLVCTTVLICGSLAACGNSSTKQANSSSKSSSSKVVKHHKKQNKKKQSSSSSASSNSNSQKDNHPNNQTNASTQQATQSSNSQKGVNNADEALAAARAKYGDGNGNYHWTVMYDADTGQPIRNADGSYFVKAIDPTQGTMTGTAQSVNVYPDGSMTNN
ncbi:hypothetical protein [Limosilactobacillus vaginalis]|uniref:hypothetical protein n=1 Tax=Limosilactobacillus vaginalis TaxID=1633 RepID=UPI0025A40F4D|nr:hypothetical protein [Limosilactobacillus vaginalis]MDM8221968.1 hypothetical protein [Limosilactobacillus vaginalis]